MRLLLVLTLLGCMLLLVAAKPDKDHGKGDDKPGNGPPPHAVANGLATPVPTPMPPDVVIVEPPPVGHFDPPLEPPPVVLLPNTAVDR